MSNANVLLVLPILIPFVTAIMCILAWQRRALQRSLSLIGTTGLLIAGLALLVAGLQNGILTTRIGNWPAPYGIVLVADLFSAVMVVIAGLVGVCVAIYSIASIHPRREVFGYYPVMLILLMGVCGAFLTGDMFNLYVWFEVMLISSFVLLALGGERAQLEGSIKYFSLNMLVSAFFLAAVGFTYSITGSLNMADLAIALNRSDRDGIVTVLAILFLVTFGIKAAVFPLFFWLPASYHTPPVAVTTLFSALMTKVGVYAAVRVFTLLFTQDVGYTHTLIMVIAGLTMVTGVLGAVAQYDFRRLLSFHIISQIGYLMMGLGLFTVASLAGTVFFMVHVIIAKSALFLVSGVAFLLGRTYDLKQLGSLYKGFPLLAALFFIPAMSLGGIPPLSGFWAKLALVNAGLAAQQYAIVAVALGVSILTLFSMTKIWAEAFWKDSPIMDKETIVYSLGHINRGQLILKLAPVILLAALTVILGLAAEPLLTLSTQAAEQLLNRQGYIQAVLGVGQ